jgi:Leucine-rich repeat (LRR) protein
MHKTIIITLFLISVINTKSVLAQGREEDSLALVDLYDSTDGDNWTNNTNWKSDTIDTWYGVTVSDNRVTQLDLHSDNLSGTIPSSIGDLTNLTYLDLENNQLSGSIPSSIGNLPNLLTLDFNENNLTGSIPSSIGDLSELRNLFLEDNELLGTIPPSIENLTKLQHLYLFDNQLSGSIPPEIGGLAGLMWARLEDNQFTGSIPSTIGDLSKLKRLYISNNELEGSIPAEIGDLTDMEDLQLQGNELTGSIPPEIGNLTKVIQLYLYRNQLEGSIPEEIGDMTSLQNLLLNNNQLTDEVPSEIADLSSLSHLHIYNNDLVDLPELSSLSELLIQNNQFTFEDIEPNIGISNFSYSPQDSVGESLDTTINEDSSFTMVVSAGGENNEYQWKKNESPISGATDSSYTISSAEAGDAGIYICEITNTVATDLTLYSKPINVTVNNSGVPLDLPEVYSMSVKTLASGSNFEVRYSIPVNASIKLRIYNINGAKIKEISVEKTPGIYKEEINLKGNPAGAYFFKINANEGDFTKTEKVVLIK